jgi:hypothetical protein
LALCPSVGAESIPTKEDKEDLIGTYIFKGDYKKSRNLVVELTISLDNAGQLVGHHRYKKQKTKGKCITVFLPTFVGYLQESGLVSGRY